MDQKRCGDTEVEKAAAVILKARGTGSIYRDNEDSKEGRVASWTAN